VKRFQAFLYEDIFVPKKNLGIPRNKMPQIKNAFVPDFIKFLKENDISASSKNILLTKIHATQKEINNDKILRLFTQAKEKLDYPLIVSKDMYLLDGHHRWLALIKIDPKKKRKTWVIDTDIKNLLKVTKKFDKVRYKEI